MSSNYFGQFFRSFFTNSLSKFSGKNGSIVNCRELLRPGILACFLESTNIYGEHLASNIIY